MNKRLRVGFYCPTIFFDVYKEVSTCREWHIFNGKIRLLPLPLKPILVEEPFQQRGLYFIGEIHPTSSRQNKCILIAIYYSTKWVEAIPTRHATDTVTIQFFEKKIFLGLVVLGELLLIMHKCLGLKGWLNFAMIIKLSTG